MDEVERIQMAMEFFEAEDLRKAQHAFCEAGLTLANQQNPIPQHVQDRITATFKEATSSRLQDLVVGCAKEIAKHFSDEELRAVSEFYKTPAGKTLKLKAPAYAKAITEFQTKWSQTLLAEVTRQLTTGARQQGEPPRN